ncbi:MAG: hypothetical protein WEB00_15760 [Dehalococcoidia bacterium]
MTEREQPDLIEEALEGARVEPDAGLTGDAELDEYVRLARRLGDLADPDFKDSLRRELLNEAPQRRRWSRTRLLTGLSGIAAAVTLVLLLLVAFNSGVRDSVAGAVGIDDGCYEFEEADNCRPAEPRRETYPGSLPIDWDALRRPLELPSLAPGGACPITAEASEWPSFAPKGLGDGPAYAVWPNLLSPEGTFILVASNAEYEGPLLLRGRQLDGYNPVLFYNFGHPQSELNLQGGGDQSLGQPPGWRVWGGGPEVESPGCYMVQIDGTNFSAQIVFKVTSCGLLLCSLSDSVRGGQSEAAAPFRGQLGDFQVVTSADAEKGDLPNLWPCPSGLGVASAADLLASELYFPGEGAGPDGYSCPASGDVMEVSGNITVINDEPAGRETAYITRSYFRTGLPQVVMDVEESRLVLRELAGRPALVVLRSQELSPDCTVFVIERPSGAGQYGILLSISGRFSCTAAKALAEEFLLSSVQ